MKDLLPSEQLFIRRSAFLTPNKSSADTTGKLRPFESSDEFGVGTEYAFSGYDSPSIPEQWSKSAKQSGVQYDLSYQRDNRSASGVGTLYDITGSGSTTDGFAGSPYENFENPPLAAPGALGGGMLTVVGYNFTNGITVRTREYELVDGEPELVSDTSVDRDLIIEARLFGTSGGPAVDDSVVYDSGQTFAVASGIRILVSDESGFDLNSRVPQSSAPSGGFCAINMTGFDEIEILGTGGPVGGPNFANLEPTGTNFVNFTISETY